MDKIIIITKSVNCYEVFRHRVSYGEGMQCIAQTTTLQGACNVAYPYAKEIGAEVVVRDESATMRLWEEIHYGVSAIISRAIAAQDNLEHRHA